MRTAFIFPLLVVLGTALITPAPALAQMRTSDYLKSGGSTVEFQASGLMNEICVIPSKIKTFPDTRYSKKDEEKEAKLCSLTVYENSLETDDSLTTVATCPKITSTNPGVLFVEIPGHDKKDWNKEKTENAFCKPKTEFSPAYKDAYEVEAKLKHSVTCSYTPSALAAYHVGRMLGGAGNTPVAVTRTMNRQTHEGIIAKAQDLLKDQTNTIIFNSWNMFQKKSAEHTDDKIYIDDGQQIYGALSENIKKEFIYTEVSGVGPYDTRYARFQKQEPFLRITDNRTLSEIAGGMNYRNVIPVAQQMKDVSDMIILDTLLSQDDRIGNIHFKLNWASIDENGAAIFTPLSGKEIDAVEAKTPGKSLSRWREQNFASITSDKEF
ncbi:MAG: hypothetical protein ACXVCP_03280 [Bdellovibrio sp.]